MGGRTRGTRIGNGAGYGGKAKGVPAARVEGVAPFEPGNTIQLTPPNPVPWQKRKAELSEMAMATWITVLTDKRESTQNKIVAADKIMNRVDGMPTQHIINTEQPLDQLTNEQLERGIAILRRESGGAIDSVGTGVDEAAIGKPSGIV